MVYPIIDGLSLVHTDDLGHPTPQQGIPQSIPRSLAKIFYPTRTKDRDRIIKLAH
jgi:hypothetical protein